MTEWLRSAWQRLMRRTLGHKFYITALNTFDGGPPGNFRSDEVEHITRRFLQDAKTSLKRPPLGFYTRQSGLARALLLLSDFWHQSSREWKRVAEQEQERTLRLLEHCELETVSVPLQIIWKDEPELLEALAAEGINTWEALLQRANCDHLHPPLYLSACQALRGQPGKQSPRIAILYWHLYALLDQYGIFINIPPLSERTRHEPTN